MASKEGNLMSRLIWLFGRAMFYLVDLGHHNMDIMTCCGLQP